MAKLITRRDVAVFNVVTAFMPDTAELTIVKYYSLSTNQFEEKQEWVALVKTSLGQLDVQLFENGNNCIPASVEVEYSLDSRYLPGAYRVSTDRSGYVFKRQ